MCPHHQNARMPSCPLCHSVIGGFVSGFVTAPYSWKAGADRMRSMGGIILGAPGTREREQQMLMGQEFRALWNIGRASVYNIPGVPNLRQVWQQIPEPARADLTDAGFRGLGQLGGSMAASRVAVFAVSFFTSRVLMQGMGITTKMVMRSPLGITVGTILSALSMQATFGRLSNAQDQIFRKYPGTERQLRDFLHQVNSPPPKRGGVRW